MAAVRRLARQVNTASPSGNRLVAARPISTSVPFPSQSVEQRQPQSKQRASSWAALSRAGQSLFAATPSSTPPPRPAEPYHPSLVLKGLAAELVQELKRATPDPARCWSLFNQLDIRGESHTLPLVSLHFLLRAMVFTPPNRKTLDVDSSTSLAKDYAMKVEVVKLRIVQGGGRITQTDFQAQILQYYLFKYAPGSCKVWDEMIQAGLPPPQKNRICINAFESLVDWIDMHEEAGGKSLARLAAQPLVPKALSMMEDLQGDKRRMDQVLEYFFKVALKATDKEIFSMAMREVYGFDMALPGAEVYSKEEVRARRKKLGEKEVEWVLEMLAETKDLSGMIATFEVIDNPPPPPDETADLGSNYFVPSFASEPPSIPEAATTTSSLPTPPPSSTTTPHLIGTRAFELMIRTASRLGRGAIARQYFNQLYWRWQMSADQRLSEIESAVGIEQPKKVSGGGVSPVDSVSATTAGDKGRAQEERRKSPQITMRYPEKDYMISSALIYDMTRHANLFNDLATARYLRQRTLRILQLMGSHTNRFEAVLRTLEETLNPTAPPLVAAAPSSPSFILPPPALQSPPPPSYVSEASDSTTKTQQDVDAILAGVESSLRIAADLASHEEHKLDAIPRSLKLLAREVEVTTYHRVQLRYMFEQLKAESNVIASYVHLRRLMYTLSARVKKLTLNAGNKAAAAKLKAGVKRKEHQVLSGRVLLLRQRIKRLQVLGKAHVGGHEYDTAVRMLKELKRQADDRLGKPVVGLAVG